MDPNLNEEALLENQMKELSAYAIQNVWRKYQMLKAIRQTLRSKREPVVVYYSSLSQNQKIKSDQFNLFNMLNAKRINFFKFDLVDNKMAQGWVKEQLNKYQLPFVKINDIFVGGFEEVSILYELDMLQKIAEKGTSVF